MSNDKTRGKISAQPRLHQRASAIQAYGTVNHLLALGRAVEAADLGAVSFRGILQPTLIVWGDRDTIIPVSHARAAHEAISGSRLEIIEGAGHFPHVEEPLRFVELLSEFIDSTQPNRVTAEERRALLLRDDVSNPGT